MQSRIFKIFLLAVFLVLPNFVFAEDKLLQQNDLIYQGAFKVPLGSIGDSIEDNSFAYGGTSLVYNPANNSLFISGYHKDQMLAEITIPDAVDSASLSALPRAAVIQGFKDLSDSHLAEIGTGGSVFAQVGDTDGGGIGIGGAALLPNDKLLLSIFAGYDLDKLSIFTHFMANQNWNESVGFSGMLRIKPPLPEVSAAFVDGYMSAVPNDWQMALGGSFITGQMGLSGINRTSRGPSAFAFYPENFSEIIGTENNPLSAQPLLYYPQNHPSVGDYGINETLVFTRTTRIRGVVFPEGTKSVLFFGQTGLGKDGNGKSCYGEGTSVQSEAKDNAEMDLYWAENLLAGSYTCGANLIARQVPNVDECCYDPASLAKGDHAYPYVYYIWAYNADDLAVAKTEEYVVTPEDEISSRFVTEVPVPMSILTAGNIVHPWNVKPYGLWTITFPIMPSDKDYRIRGAAYDSINQKIYISQWNGEQNGERFPLIHVFQLNLPISSDTTPPSAPIGLSVM